MLKRVYGHTFLEFVQSPRGHALWDSPRVSLVLDTELVFELVGNNEVERDDLDLINFETREFTANARNYVVTGFAQIAGTNYIFIEMEGIE
jgi:hypothetical protein